MEDPHGLAGQVIGRAYIDMYYNNGTTRPTLFDVILVLADRAVALRKCTVRREAWETRPMTWTECQDQVAGATIAEVEASQDARMVLLKLANGTSLLGELEDA